MTLAFANRYFLGVSGLKQGGLGPSGDRASLRHDSLQRDELALWRRPVGRPSGQGPDGAGNGVQFCAQYAPPSGPLALECQVPPSKVRGPVLDELRYGGWVRL